MTCIRKGSRASVADAAAVAAIYLNGVQVYDVVRADEDLGIVVRHVRDLQGRLVAAGEGWAVETVSGEVRIEWRESPDAT